MKVKESRCLENLNEQQKEVVLNYDGPCIVLSGPGSGKTTTITRRVAYMIENGIKPYNILLMTFTNKAANEMKEKIKKMSDGTADSLTVGTYHSVCCRILRKYASLIGYESNFTIFDTDDSKGVIKRLLGNAIITENEAYSYICKFKQDMYSIEEVKAAASTQKEKLVAEVYERYQNSLKNQNAMDFEDLIVNTIKCLESFPYVREELHCKYKYVIADESQDSATRDIRFLELLMGDEENLCLVGDEDQCIYGFRGARVEELLNFKDQLKTMKVYTLTQNYRCSQNIVKAAKSLIERNSTRINKDLFTENNEGSPVLYIKETDEYSQAAKCSSIINLLKAQYKLEYKDIAILYRTSSLSKAIEDAFLKSAIPYNIVGGLSFYARKEIKDLVSYIRFLYNGSDFEAFKRCIQSPRRGIGDSSLDLIYKEFEQTGDDILTICKRITFTNSIKSKMEDFVKQMTNLKEKINSFENVGKFIEYLLAKVNYIQSLEKDKDKLDRIENINELINFAYSFDTVLDFVSTTSLSSKESEEESLNKVQLSTIHAAKGLEYKAVIIVSVNEKVIPHARSLNPNQIEEERRLLYVAMTRAKEYLFLISTSKTTMRGYTIEQTVSRFVNEIDTQYVVEY